MVYGKDRLRSLFEKMHEKLPSLVLWILPKIHKILKKSMVYSVLVSLSTVADLIIHTATISSVVENVLFKFLKAWILNKVLDFSL